MSAAQPLVLLHALGTDRHMWDPVLPRLEAEREVIALDMPGFGSAAPLQGGAGAGTRGAGAGAEGPAAPSLVAGRGEGAGARGEGAAAPPGASAGAAHVTPRDLARAIAAQLSARGLDRPHVAGNSLGGWVALELALAGHARSVTAIAPAGLWAQPLAPKRSTARLAARAARPLLPALLKRPGGKRAALGGTIAHPERVPYDAALGLVRAYAEAPGFDAVNAGMRANVFAGLGEITVPLTLAWPEFDKLVSRPDSVPASAREVFLDGCGHMPTWDDPERVAEVLLAGSSVDPPS